MNEDLEEVNWKILKKEIQMKEELFIDYEFYEDK